MKSAVDWIKTRPCASMFGSRPASQGARSTAPICPHLGYLGFGRLNCTLARKTDTVVIANMCCFASIGSTSVKTRITQDRSSWLSPCLNICTREFVEWILRHQRLTKDRESDLQYNSRASSLCSCTLVYCGIVLTSDKQ